MSRIVMLRAVELDDKSRAMTGEIRAIRTNRHLPPEVETSAFKFAYVKPKEKFGVGQFPAQRSRTLQAQRNSPTRTRLHCLRSFGAVRPQFCFGPASFGESNVQRWWIVFHD